MDWFDVVSLPELPVVWRRIFVPSQTRWREQTTHEFLQEKAQALQVLFLDNPHFRRGGVHVAREYMDWCDVHHHGDYRLWAVAKAKAYLEYRVTEAQQRWMDDKDAGAPKNNTADECAYNAFRSATCHLDSLARWQGYPRVLLEEESIQVLRDRLIRAQNKSRADVRDYAASSRFLTKRLTQEEMESITECWWNGSAAELVAATVSGQERAQMRGFLLHCLQKNIGRRGADLRNLRLSMFFKHALSHTKPVTPCTLVGASLRHVKECAENVEHLLGWTRACDRWACPVGALACYLVWLNDLGMGNAILEEIRRDLRENRADRPWWRRMLFGDARETPISYSSHHKVIAAGYEASCVSHKTAATHIYRSTVGCEQIERGVAFTDVGVYQGWHHDTAADRYLRGAFKSDPLLRAHGWSNGVEGFECWWEGEQDHVPTCLLDVVFPGLDDMLDVATNQYKKTGNDRSSIEFLKMLQYLRKVFLEDAVAKRKQYPHFPVYARHRAFRMAEWHEYAHAEGERVAAREREAKRNKEQDEMQASMGRAIEDAMQKMMTMSLRRATQETKAAKAAKLAEAATLLVATEVEAPREEDALPEMQDPTCLYACYQSWQGQRDYFYAHSHPPWKKRFGDKAATMKLRYSRMRPFLMYLDRCGATARRALDALDAFRKEKGVPPSVFIKQCFYHLEHPVSESCKKPPPILPHELRAMLDTCKLPPCLAEGVAAAGNVGVTG